VRVDRHRLADRPARVLEPAGDIDAGPALAGRHDLALDVDAGRRQVAVEAVDGLRLVEAVREHRPRRVIPAAEVHACGYPEVDDRTADERARAERRIARQGAGREGAD